MFNTGVKMEKIKIGVEERESLVKALLNTYCKYLMDQSSVDLLHMVETRTMTVAEAMLSGKD